MLKALTRQVLGLLPSSLSLCTTTIVVTGLMQTATYAQYYKLGSFKLEGNAVLASQEPDPLPPRPMPPGGSRYFGRNS
ncbi:MAG TPA: hypothetical protein DDZ80_19395 [Cyanobacteria bacterium UBA8803]|nr:hypothetical protein [Cyanobacteria bacterium UBA9273]HBL60538.1 hypothetical protein [Cyanobacteria bacterium UBA8803]